MCGLVDFINIVNFIINRYERAVRLPHLVLPAVRPTLDKCLSHGRNQSIRSSRKSIQNHALDSYLRTSRVREQTLAIVIAT